MNNTVTEEGIRKKIKSVSYMVIHGTTTTVCNIFLVNGFSVQGTSACADPANFDQAKGEAYSYEDAFNKIWPLEGYLLKERMHSISQRIDKIAEACHEANRIYCQSIGDQSVPFWKDAPKEQKESVREGVKAHLTQDLTPEQSHSLWMRRKLAEGWVHGEKKDPVLKTHPCLLPFEMLPQQQQIKDSLFISIVHSLRD